MSRNFNKLLSLVLVLMMVVSTMVIVPLTASAEDAALGTAANPIKVGTVDELKALSTTMAEATADEDGRYYVVLTADIDFDTDSDPATVTRGTANIALGKSIHLDGQNHTVKNYTFAHDTGSGLFKTMYSYSTVKNLHVSNAVGEGGNCAGLIVGYAMYGFTMINCSADAASTITGVSGGNGKIVGGLVGSIQEGKATPSVFKNCVNYATVTGLADAGKAGGILGHAWNPSGSMVFENCVNYGTISGNNAGGIYGYVEKLANVSMTNCVNNGTLSGNTLGGMIANVTAGEACTVTLSRCVNKAAINSVGHQAGGMIGYAAVPGTSTATSVTFTLEYCVNEGAVTSQYNVGGMIGYAFSHINLDMDYCVNLGAITSNGTEQYTDTSNMVGVGGMLGFAMYYNSKASNSRAITSSFTNCYNKGNIVQSNAVDHASGDKAIGGLVGEYRVYGAKDQFANSLTFTNCVDVSEKSYPSGYKCAAMVGFASAWEFQTLTFENCAGVAIDGTKYTYTVDAKRGVSSTPTDMFGSYGLVGGGTGSDGKAPNQAVNIINSATINTLDDATVNAGIAAVNAAIYTPVITTESKNLEVRLKLTDDFGFLAAASMWVGADDAGFVFATDAAALQTAEKVSGQTYNGELDTLYATYTGISAAKLGTTVYFAAYVTVDGVTYYSAARNINCAELAEDLTDGYYGDAATGVQITANPKEMALYAAMCDYYAAYDRYLDTVTPA